jgi:lipopolysaccharide biosynthesis regulator YciM
MIVLFLGSVLLGLLVAGFLHGTLSLKAFFRNLKTVGRIKRENKTNRRSEKLLEEAENLIACGYISKAVSKYKKILNISPNNVNVLVRLGNILREQGNLDHALELHLKAEKIAPEKYDILYSLADDYSAKIVPKKELKILEKILGLDQSSPRILYRMREIYLKSEDWMLVVDTQRKLIGQIEGKANKEKEKKMLSQYIYKSGIRYFYNDNFDLAITEFKRALRENSQCLPAHLLLGDAYLKTGDNRGAMKAWKKGYASTKSATCMIRMEEVYRDLGKIGEMIKEYKEAISRTQEEEREALVILLGLLCLKEKNPQETIRAIEENTDFEESIILSIILSDAYKQDHIETKSKKALESVTKKIKRAVFNFKCSVCGKISGEWGDNCSVCNSFDTVEYFPILHS